jgi:hypothetical protein
MKKKTFMIPRRMWDDSIDMDIKQSVMMWTGFIPLITGYRDELL